MQNFRRGAVISRESRAVAENARRLYESRLRGELEQKHPGRYACIEPVSGRYFLRDTFDQAVNAAIDGSGKGSGKGDITDY
jgi:hypothetical protein